MPKEKKTDDPLSGILNELGEIRTELTGLRETITELNRNISLFLERKDAREEKKMKLVSREEAASRLDVSTSTLWRWNKNGILPVTVFKVRRPFYSEEALEQFENGELFKNLHKNRS